MRGLPNSPANHTGGSLEGIFILCEFMGPPGPFYLARPNMHTCDHRRGWYKKEQRDQHSFIQLLLEKPLDIHYPDVAAGRIA